MVLAGVLVTPWLNPFAPGPSPAVVPLLVSWACVAIALLFHRHLRVDVVAGAWLIAAAVSAAIGHLQYLGIDGRFFPWINHAGIGQAFGNLRQRNQFASLLVIGLAALWWWIQAEAARPMSASLSRQSTKRILGLLVVAGLASATAASASRTGLVAWLIVSLLAWRWSADGGRTYQRWMIGTGLTAFFLASWFLPMTIGHDPLQHGLLSRLDPMGQGCFNRSTLWANVVYLIAQRPWLGWGLGELDYAHYVTLYPGPRFCDILDNAHNLPLHLAVELGLPIAVAACAGALYWIVRRRPWSERDPDRQLAWLVLVVLAWHSLLEYPLWYGPFQLAVGLALWVLLSPKRSNAGDAARVSPARMSKQGAWVSASRCAAAVLLVGCTLVAWEYRRVSQIYLSTEDRATEYRQDTLARTRTDGIFRNQWEFAALTTGVLSLDNAGETLARAERLLHYSPEARVVEQLIESAELLDRNDLAQWHKIRFKAAFPRAFDDWVDRRQAPESRRTNAP